MATKTKENQTDWKGLIQGFVGNVLERLSDNVSKKVHEFIKQLKRRSIGAVLLLVGAIFFLAGIAMFLNFIIGSQMPWFGWSVVGFVVFLAGFELSRK